MKQFFSVRTLLIGLCMVSVLALVSCATGRPPNVHYELARVYLGQRAMVPGDSGDFWEGLRGTPVAIFPWEGGPEDAHGEFFMAANSTHFFIRAEIQDASPGIRPTTLPADLAWNGTSIQVFFGPEVSRRGTFNSSDSGLTFWVVQDDMEDPATRRVQVARAFGIMNPQQANTALVEWNEDSYIIEASFPLAALGITRPMRLGQGIRVEFRINHAPHGLPRSVIVNWRTFGDDAWHNPNAWSYGVVMARPDGM